TEDQELHVDVTDMLGQVVYRGAINVKNGDINSRIELNSGLANGMYMLTLRSGSEAKVFHFVLQQ
ncbi:MAG: T9SS type A sorting domain-containing protein, partial [Taibaiella sp.]|nr:T9SS type A sorting domain-containing protein [Taibaiella sp.]MBX2907750.1 T9SS type A sorting domain-containing protein [Taibaiella sp.]